ncbi:MAG: DUF1273 domain-containing protein [Ruminococcaceae bacterium]|nr:DUF1273 domain-containing protein [Oscillospiraceae bacterium]
MSNTMTCCFTGHRTIAPASLPLLEEALERAVASLVLAGYSYFGSGGALGFDLLAARAVLKAKKAHPHLRLFMALPCRSQDKFWSPEQKRNYSEVLCASDEIIYTAEGYFRGCMQKRNRYLVNRASCLVAYLNRKTGGTKYTVDYAQKAGVPVLFLPEEPAFSLPRQQSFFEYLTNN